MVKLALAKLRTLAPRVMQFVNPTVLWAFGLLAVPLAIHLFNLRRYKTIYFSDLTFLKEVKQSTRRQRKLKEWLVLAARLLALSALILAFAKPFIPAKTTTSVGKKVVIYLDVSASTQAGKKEFSPFERGKQLALVLLNQLPAEAKIALITQASRTDLVYQSVDEIREVLRNLQATDGPGVLLSSGDVPVEKGTTVFVVSDMPRNSLDLGGFAADSASWILLPTIEDDEAQLNNVAVDSTWVSAPFLMAGQPVDYFVRLKQFGAAPAEVNLEILTNGLPEISLSVRVRGNSDTIIKTNLTQLKSGFNRVEANLLNDETPFDDSYAQVFFVPIANRVTELYEDSPSPLIAELFSGNEFQFTSMPAKSANNLALEKSDLIILNSLSEMSAGLLDALTLRAANANVLCIAHASNNTANNILAAKLGIKQFSVLDTANLASKLVNANDPFFADVFSGSLQKAYWPNTKQHFRLSGNALLPTFPLLQLANGDNILVRYARGQNNIFQLAVPLSERFSDLTTHPVVVPLFIKSLLKSNSISGFTGTVGSDQRFVFEAENTGEKPAQLEKGTWQILPQQQLSVGKLSIIAGAEVQESGIYTLQKDDDTLGQIAFTIPKAESDMKRFTSAELQDWLDEYEGTNVTLFNADAATLPRILRDWQQGKQLWKWALALAIFFVLIEVILLKLLK